MTNTNNKQQLEIKRFSTHDCKLALSDTLTDSMEFSGYGAAFGNIDSYGDVIEKGAFSNYLSDVKTGKQDWPAMLMQHGGFGMNADDFTPVGVYTDLTEDNYGLKTIGKLAPTAKGTETYELMKMTPRPAISGLSIGFFTREQELGTKNDPYNRLLKQIDLVEISIVTFPANNMARINNVKSANDFSEREFEKLLRDVCGLSQKEAKIVISKGFRALISSGDVENEELKKMASLIRSQNSIFTNR